MCAKFRCPIVTITCPILIVLNGIEYFTQIALNVLRKRIRQSIHKDLILRDSEAEFYNENLLFHRFFQNKSSYLKYMRILTLQLQAGNADPTKTIKRSF